MIFKNLSIQDIEFEPVEQIFTESFLEKAEEHFLDLSAEKLHYEILLTVMKEIQKHKEDLSFEVVFRSIMRTYNKIETIKEEF